MSPVHHVVEWETVNCDLCNSTEAEREFDGIDWEYGLEGQFSVVTCRGCGLKYLNPRPSQSSLTFIYPTSYGFYRPPSRLNRFRKLIPGDITKSHYSYLDDVTPGSILDVGCATGHSVYPYGESGSLKDLKKRGWETFGCDIDEKAAALGRSAGIHIQVGHVEDVARSGKRFDVVRFNHVLEHSVSPTDDLAAAVKLLKIKGRLIISGPNIQSAPFFLFNKYWSGLDLPRHFYHFTPATLNKYCAKLGLHLDREYYDGYAADLVHSLKHFLQSAEVVGRNYPCCEANAVSTVFGSVSQLFLYQIAESMTTLFNDRGLGDNYTLVAGTD